VISLGPLAARATCSQQPSQRKDLDVRHSDRGVRYDHEVLMKFGDVVDKNLYATDCPVRP
jgi:hypothetical protein